MLIRSHQTLEGVFAHFNRIMGPGGGAIADALCNSKSLKLLDLSFNSICSNGKIQGDEDGEERTEKNPKAKAKRSQTKNLIVG